MPPSGQNTTVLSRSQRVKAAAIAATTFPLIAALGRTLSWKVEGADHFDRLIDAGRPPILALWHGRILPATLFWRDRGIVALTSQNFDGEWVARLMARFGYRAARGSTSRGGARALIRLRRELAAGDVAAFTLDGPRGPARVAQPGAVWLAGATGHPLLPFAIETDRCWTLSTWDATQVPRPFSTVAVVVGEPLYVSATGEDVLEQARADLEARLASLEGRARALLHD